MNLINLANFFTSLRIILIIPISILLVSTGDWHLSLISLILFIIAGITDFLDGFFARIQKKESEFGKLFDPLADKILIVSVLLTIIYTKPDFYPFWIIILIIIRDFIVSDFRFFTISKKSLFKTLFMAKLKTVLQFFSIISALIFIVIEKYCIQNDVCKNLEDLFSNLFGEASLLFINIPFIILLLALYFSWHSGIIYLIRSLKIITGKK